MPFDPVLQAAWFKLFGVHAFAMRSLHILLGLAALTAWGSLRQLPQAKAVRYAGCSCREHSTVPFQSIFIIELERCHFTGTQTQACEQEQDSVIATPTEVRRF